ncbi:MAG: class III extradiol ring-cleavage dioxygenase [Rhodopila sp.]
MLPALFLSHGSPMLALTDSPARDFLRGLGREIGKPSAIVVASAHWETEVPTFNSVALNGTIHDFYGFPPALFAMRYEPPGSPSLAAKAATLVKAAGLASATNTERGLDHGAGVPLSLMYPAADSPVMQVGLQFHLGPAHHLRLGRALAALRAEEVLVVGSGSFTHNLERATELGRQGHRDGAHFGPSAAGALLNSIPLICCRCCCRSSTRLSSPTPFRSNPA